MTRRDAQNAIKALAFVDQWQVPSFSDATMSAVSRWKEFQRDPAKYFASAPPDVADQIWAAMFPARLTEPETFTGPAP